MKTLFALTCTLAALQVSSPALAHGDEDHSKKPAASSSAKAKASGLSTAFSVESNKAQRLSDGSLFVPKIVQRQLAITTLMSEVANLPSSIELNGKVMADPNAGGHVQASQSGRIEALGSGLPNVGQRVVKGQVLAYLRPTMSSLDRGNGQSLLADIDSQLAIAEAKVRRYALAEAAFPRATIEAAQFEFDALKKRKQAIATSLVKTETLFAPVSGVISVAKAVTGQVVDAKETLFEIIDPNRLMVEALAYDPILTHDIASAYASWQYQQTSQNPQNPQANKINAISLSFIGGGQQMREQAIPLLFRVQNKQTALAVGQSLKVILQTKKEIQGVAVPQAAVVKLPAGEFGVWVHTEAERFVLRKVNAYALDAERLNITHGVKENERIVITGASLLAQVR
jgi:RND family efflux transporter MFP subunit